MQSAQGGPAQAPAHQLQEAAEGTVLAAPASPSITRFDWHQVEVLQPKKTHSTHAR